MALKMKKVFIFLIIAFLAPAEIALAEPISPPERTQVQDAELLSSTIEIFSAQTRRGERFGLKSDMGEVLVGATYKKLIRIGSRAWICQRNNNRFGLIDKNGNYLVQPRFRFADRLYGRFAKLGNSRDFGLYDEKGHAVIAPEFSSIEPMQFGMFLTYQNYKYGIINARGEVLLANKFDAIYSPERNKLHVRFQGEWYELDGFPEEQGGFSDPSRLTINKIVANPVTASGFGAVSGANYLIKIVSALSPAYEKTIDDLVYSQGADAVNILMGLGWIAKFPHTYIRNYYNNLKAPNTGPLSDVREGLRHNIR
jgi:hypothetical protein